MKIKVSTFHTQKGGNSRDEYEDACQPATNGEIESDHFSAAMADGASEGFLSGRWAELLVWEYCHAPDHPGHLAGFIAECETIWQDYLAAYIQHRETANRPIQWYEEPGLANGAFSTLIGLSISEGPIAGDQAWSASAIGDTCLFQVRQSEIMCCFPIQDAGSFNTWPALVSSNPAHNLHLMEKSQSITGSWAEGDRFFLMSDAMAAWFLQECEAGHRPWEWLQGFLSKSNDAFVAWVCELRDKGEIRNDDVTFMSLSLSVS